MFFLAAITIPLQSVNLYLLQLMNAHLLMHSWVSVAIYLVLVQWQVLLMLYLSYNVVNFFWVHRINPDSSAMPVLLSVSDMVAIFTIIASFKAFHLLHEPISLPMSH